MASDITTIRVHKKTAERIAMYKIPGLSNEDVINFALDRLDPTELAKLYRAWQEEAIAKLSAVSRPLLPNPEEAAVNVPPWRGKSRSSPTPRRTSTPSSARTNPADRASRTASEKNSRASRANA